MNRWAGLSAAVSIAAALAQLCSCGLANGPVRGQPSQANAKVSTLSAAAQSGQLPRVASTPQAADADLAIVLSRPIRPSRPTPPAGSAQVWTWVSGSNTGGAKGVYGALGVPAAGNVPGARWGAVGWTDSSGNFWLFGGFGFDATGNLEGNLNDLWEFNSTSNQWTWVSGSDTKNAHGVYGTLGVAAASNIPGARDSAIGWTDSSDNFWLFGGESGAGAANGNFNDLWVFNPASRQWTWVSGSSSVNAQGVYGAMGVSAASNVPGNRWGAVRWTDSSGNFWLFGGASSTSTALVSLNDLWEFNPTSNQWTWVSGSSAANAPAVYGTLGVAAASNVPGARNSAVSWTDSGGHFWLFGGSLLNDLWEFDPTIKQWTWVSGSNTTNATGVYGTLGLAAANNIPGARVGAVSWNDGSGHFWLFGGLGLDSTGMNNILNDLWEFNPTTKEWAWESGSKTANAQGSYGTPGVAAASNVPGARCITTSWTDRSGKFWLFGGAAGSSDLNDLWRYSP